MFFWLIYSVFCVLISLAGMAYKGRDFLGVIILILGLLWIGFFIKWYMLLHIQAKVLLIVLSFYSDYFNYCFQFFYILLFRILRSKQKLRIRQPDKGTVPSTIKRYHTQDNKYQHGGQVISLFCKCNQNISCWFIMPLPTQKHKYTCSYWTFSPFNTW